MADREIIRAFDLCENSVSDGKCNKCPFGNNRDGCLNLNNHVLDLIKRQKAELERLKKENEVMKTNCNSMCTSMPNMAKAERAEAIKEFAERLKEGELYMHIVFPNTRCRTATFIVLSKNIDNLVKEMTGENNFKG